MSKQIDRAWKSLVLVSNARDTAKSREKDLVQERKDLDNRLDELVGAPNHSTVIGRCQTARRLGLLTESELQSLRGGAA